MWIALREVLSIATNATAVGFPPGSSPRGQWTVGSVSVLKTQVLAAVCAVVVISLVYVLLHRTNVGSAVRAVGVRQGRGADRRHQPTHA